MLKLELLLTAVAGIVAISFPALGSAWSAKVESSFRRFSERRLLSVAVVALLAVAARVAVLPILPVPEPALHDEFSYILMSDTFAHGRLANPTHPMWIHFETMHVIQRPTYVSKYYPAQGLFMAFGQVFLGNPFWGVVISSALMCAAICWMLQGWMPPAWALLGGLIAVIRVGMFSYWVNGYYGGAAAAFGGALVLGALPRWKQLKSLRYSVIMALGFAVLFHSRPYETVFLATPLAIHIFVWLRRRWLAAPQSVPQMRRMVASLAIGLFAVVLSIGYYFWRTTGSPVRSPYMVSLAEYAPSSMFIFGSLRPVPAYDHATMRDFYLGWELVQYKVARAQPLLACLLKFVSTWSFFLGPALTLPLVAVLFVAPPGLRFSDLSADTQLLLWVLFVSLIGMMLPVVFSPHYAAPVMCVIYALMLKIFRFVGKWHPGGRAVGPAIVRAAFVVCILLVPIVVVGYKSNTLITAPAHFTWASRREGLPDRAAISAELSRQSEPSLVIVRYSAHHDPADEWVYNLADIDSEKIIWARDMGATKNQELIDYFKSRKAWVTNPDENPPRINPYTPSAPEIISDFEHDPR